MRPPRTLILALLPPPPYNIRLPWRPEATLVRGPIPDLIVEALQYQIHKCRDAENVITMKPAVGGTKKSAEDR